MTGIKTETLSDYDLAVQEHKLPMHLPETEEVFERAMPYFTYTVPNVPRNVSTEKTECLMVYET